MRYNVLLAYYGIRIDVAAEPEEVGLLEDSTHPLMKAAEDAGLDAWWSGLPSADEASYPVFVGKQLGILDEEGYLEVRIPAGKLLATMNEVRAKLKAAGFSEEPELFLQFEMEP